MTNSRDVLKRIEQALLQPANNLYICSAITIASTFVLLAEIFFLESKRAFLLPASLTGLCALFVVYVASRATSQRLDDRLLSYSRTFGEALSFSDPLKPDVVHVLLYSAGTIGSVGGYCYLALAKYDIKPEDTVDWGIWVLDKRPLVLGYVMAASFMAFHCFMTRAFLDRRPAGIEADPSVPHARRWAARILGGVLIAFFAYTWICLPALRSVTVLNEGALAAFYDVHSHVHLATFEQIRLGATPFLEAKSQYGIGNQLVMYLLTDWIGFSNHGFFAANVLLNVVCVIGFFILLQQVLGFGWAVTALVGWVLLPSPAAVLDFSGWAILTRWLFIPVLAWLLAWLLAKAAPVQGSDNRMWAAPIAGAIWGIGGFLSQETRSGGLLVVGLSMALLGPASGMSLRSIVRFTGMYLATGAMVFFAAVSSVVGISNFLEAFQLGNVKSNLVMAGYSNSIWSSDLGLSIAFNVVRGRLQSSLDIQGDFEPLLQVYGFATLLVAAIVLLAVMPGVRQTRFFWKFSGVAVGAFVLHMFSLLRSDASHLYGPAFLLPSFLIMLPLFAWYCPAGTRMRGVLLLVSIGVLFQAAFFSKVDVVHRVKEVATVWRDSVAVRAIYDELWAFRDRSADLAARYSPIPRYQTAFRNHRDYAETEEVFALLRNKLRGRSIELTFYSINGLVTNPDAFYFYGGFRSVSGITLDALWLKSEENAWIREVVDSPHACIFFGPNSRGGMVEAWNAAARPQDAVVTEPIVGRRAYGFLSCKP